MQIDSRAAEFAAASLSAEVCVIGAGIAGILLAHKLARAGKDVIVLEAGPLHADAGVLQSTPDPKINENHRQQLDAGRVEMPEHLHPGSAQQPAEAFGGTSLIWGGQLLPLPQDAASSHEAESRWPVTPAELARFYTEAEQIFGVDDLPYGGPPFFEAMRAAVPPVFANLPKATLRVSKFAPFSQRNLAQTLGPELLRHPRVHVLFEARVIRLVYRKSSDSETKFVEAAVAKLPTGQTLRVEAKQFVVAAGTLESVRLLLASRAFETSGAEGEHDPLGRSVHDHLTVTGAVFTGAARSLVLDQLRPWLIRGAHGTTAHSLKLEASADLRRRLGLQAAMAHLTIEEPESSPIGTLRAMLRSRQERGVAGLMRSELRHVPAALTEAVHLAWAARVHKRRYVSPQATTALRFNTAQSIASFNRILLSHRMDEAGQPKPVLKWKVGEDECAALVRFAAHVRENLGSFGDDRNVQWTPSLFLEQGSTDEVLDDLTDARHLMGGAVMGADARTSVVDAKLRVHGVANLHVASLATFPDGDVQLPTLTLAALALRLGERLGR